MFWPTEPSRVPLTELGRYNTIYLSTCPSHYDPTIIWGTHVEVDGLDAFLASRSRETNLFISPAHLLLRAVAETFREHPEFNRRVIGRRVYPFRGVDLVMPMLQTRRGEVGLVFLRSVEDMSLDEIARRLWSEAHEKAVQAATEEQLRLQRSPFTNWCVEMWRRLRLNWIHTMVRVGLACTNRFRLPSSFFSKEYNGASALVNYLAYPDGPPITMFKPSRLPMNSCHVNVTMGPPEDRPLVVGDSIVIRKVAPLFIRADHRTVDTRQIAGFLKTLCGYLAKPHRLTECDETRSNLVSRIAA